MDFSSSSLEVCGSTKTLVEDKELNLAQLEDIEMKTEAVAGRCSIDNVYRKSGVTKLEKPGSDKKACACDTLTEDREHIEEIKELHAYLDMVKTMVRPGCSPEVLKMALNSMSTLFNILTFASSTTRPPKNGTQENRGEAMVIDKALMTREMICNPSCDILSDDLMPFLTFPPKIVPDDAAAHNGKLTINSRNHRQR
ncbi:unnamed protein product [Dovyalis caffra]|uniref:Uncharacterized protein n=1 Tax=Dovyalis caffra TaxID=77055 RepID=A0AAV1RUK1_9ROSI|nr:unnamed protein product [Dovyalis caffra]